MPAFHGQISAELYVDNYWIKRLPSQFDNFGNDQIEKNTYGNSSATKVETRCFAYPKKLLAEMPASALKSGKADLLSRLIGYVRINGVDQ